MLRRASYTWTTEEEAKLKDMAQSGLYLRNIAVRLRRSESSVKKRARDLGVMIKQRPRFRLEARTRSLGRS